MLIDAAGWYRNRIQPLDKFLKQALRTKAMRPLGALIPETTTGVRRPFSLSFREVEWELCSQRDPEVLGMEFFRQKVRATYGTIFLVTMIYVLFPWDDFEEGDLYANT